MIKSREMHQTRASWQARKQLLEITLGLWQFMAQLDFSEAESDPIIEQMLQFVNFAQEQQIQNEKQPVTESFMPQRQIDVDILWLKSQGR